MDVKPIRIQLHTFLTGKSKSNYIFFFLRLWDLCTRGSPQSFEAVGLGVLFILKLKELVKDLHKG